MNIASIDAIHPTLDIGRAPYLATKAGVLGLSLKLARELARLHITVNVVGPQTHTDRECCHHDRMHTR